MRLWLARIAIGIAVIFLAILGGLFAMSKRANAGVMTASIEIARPPAEVRRWFTDGDKLTQWVGWLTKVEVVGTPTSGAGTRQRWTMQDPRNGPMQFERVTEVDDDTMTVVVIKTPGLFTGRLVSRYAATPTGGTRVTSEGRFTYDSFVYTLLEPLVTPEAEKKEHDDFARLKQKAEAAPAASVAVPAAAPAAPAPAAPAK
jgi:uncharacterized protein YndB with AHSA1/START domain